MTGQGIFWLLSKGRPGSEAEREAVSRPPAPRGLGEGFGFYLKCNQKPLEAFVQGVGVASFRLYRDPPPHEAVSSSPPEVVVRETVVGPWMGHRESGSVKPWSNFTWFCKQG